MLKIEQSKKNEMVLFLDALEATPKQIQTAARRALNKTARWMRTTIARKVAKEKDVGVGLIRKSIKLDTASGQKFSSELKLGRRSRVVSAYKTGRARQTKKGVRVKGRFYEGAFIATMPKTGHKGVYRRKGKERFPLQEMYFVIAPAIQAAMEEYVGDKGQRYLQRTFNHELKFVMSK